MEKCQVFIWQYWLSLEKSILFDNASISKTVMSVNNYCWGLKGPESRPKRLTFIEIKAVFNPRAVIFLVQNLKKVAVLQNTTEFHKWGLVG